MTGQKSEIHATWAGCAVVARIQDNAVRLHVKQPRLDREDMREVKDWEAALFFVDA